MKLIYTAALVVGVGVFGFYVFPVATEYLFGAATAQALADKELSERGLTATLHSVNDYGDGRYGVIYLDGPRRIDVRIENGKAVQFQEWKNPHAK